MTKLMKNILVSAFWTKHTNLVHIWLTKNSSSCSKSNMIPKSNPTGIECGSNRIVKAEIKPHPASLIEHPKEEKMLALSKLY